MRQPCDSKLRADYAWFDGCCEISSEICNRTTNFGVFLLKSSRRSKSGRVFNVDVRFEIEFAPERRSFIRHLLSILQICTGHIQRLSLNSSHLYQLRWYVWIYPVSHRRSRAVGTFPVWSLRVTVIFFGSLRFLQVSDIHSVKTTETGGIFRLVHIRAEITPEVAFTPENCRKSRDCDACRCDFATSESARFGTIYYRFLSVAAPGGDHGSAEHAGQPRKRGANTVGFDCLRCARTSFSHARRRAGVFLDDWTRIWSPRLVSSDVRLHSRRCVVVGRSGRRGFEFLRGFETRGPLSLRSLPSLPPGTGNGVDSKVP